MQVTRFPQTQRELFRLARGDLSQRAFAKMIGVERSLFCRYEGEKLGAPIKVLNTCLKAVAQRSGKTQPRLTAQQHALAMAREAVLAVENLEPNISARSRLKTKRRRPTRAQSD